MRARYYEPTIGRFISEDSARTGLNWFAYCSGNPVRAVDVSGKDEEEEESVSEGISGMLMNLGLNFYLRFAVIFESRLLICSEWVQKNAGIVVNYRALVDDLNTFATSQDAFKVVVAFNDMTRTPGGQAFLQKLLQAASESNGDVQVERFTSVDNPLIQMAWLVAGED
jgi:hypothetical protein